MKKILSIVSILLLGITIVYAQTQYNTGTNKTVTLTQDINSLNIQVLSKIWLLFCNDWLDVNLVKPSLAITTRPWKNINICNVFYSKSEKDASLNIWFSEWYKNKNNQISCRDSMTDNFFSDNIITTGSELGFSLWSGKHIIKNIQFKIPKTASGEIYWCIAYYTPDSFAKTTGDVFWTFVRKVSPFSVTITWSVYNFWRRDDLKDATIANKDDILKVIIGILGLRIIVTIIQISKKSKKEKKHHKKK